METKKKKLTLDTQTVRRLTKDELDKVRGGDFIPSEFDGGGCAYSRTCADSKGGTARRCRN